MTATILDGFTITGGAIAGILNNSSSPTMSYLVVTGNGGAAPTPFARMFFDPANGDFRLISCSPAINNGSNSYFVSGRNPDISLENRDPDGNPRIYNQGTIDIGAYEYQSDKVATPTYVLYVKEGADGSGFSWDCPSGDLRFLIASAQSGDQIWVAEGTCLANFYPFEMKEGLKFTVALKVIS